MSDALYSTRLRWSAGSRSGAAILRGRRVELTEPPALPSVPDLAEIDYVPEIHMGRIRRRNYGWRDMEGMEWKEADALLVTLTRGAA